ncbi:MAG: uracil-DNA glycosylase [Bacteroidetes bacterium]|nr:MAG: uracil-DNA glycosylase [Bacteroidota bacterium]
MEQFSPIEKQESLDVLNYQIRSCKKCGLHTTRKHALVGEGNINANIMFVALSPGAKEDVQNKMFVGPSGKVFNKLLYAAGIDRNRVFMTNLVKCILPGNRKPKVDEIESCSLFLNDEIAIIQPKIIVPLGYYATRSILLKFNANPDYAAMSFKNINGQLLNFSGVKVYPLTHPSALLYNPSFEAVTIEKYKNLKGLTE